MAGMFAAAAQPDVLRAAQKDQQYLSIVTEALSSAVSGVAGQFRRLQWERWGHETMCPVWCTVRLQCRHLHRAEQSNVCAYFGRRETHVAAGVLYYALTTGAGLQTLGEEYCDLLQITGLAVRELLAWSLSTACGGKGIVSYDTHFYLPPTGGMPMEPTAARRAVLVALQSLAPYCMARWAPAIVDREDSGSWRDDSPAVLTSPMQPDSGGQLPPLPHQRLWQQVSMSVVGCAVPWQNRC